MKYNNPIHEAIYKNVVRPEMNKRKTSIEGWVFRVNYEEQTALIQWRDPDSGAERFRDNVPFPVDGDGVFKQSLEEGDYVTISFRHGRLESPYISMVHKKKRPVSYSSKYGADIPKGMGFL
jgi:hypothetical protein